VHGLDGKTYQPRPVLDEAALREREQAAEERRNDELRIRSMCSALATHELLQHPDNRAWTIRAARDYPDAIPQLFREFHTPEAIRRIAGWLRQYADELEETRHAA
jgi:hypothetical protein